MFAIFPKSLSAATWRASCTIFVRLTDDRALCWFALWRNQYVSITNVPSQAKFCRRASSGFL